MTYLYLDLLDDRSHHSHPAIDSTTKNAVWGEMPKSAYGDTFDRLSLKVQVAEGAWKGGVAVRALKRKAAAANDPLGHR